MKAEQLVTQTIGKMREAGYSENTLDVYRVLYKQLLSFMEDRGIDTYSPEVGAQALPILRMARNCEKNRRQFGVIVKHLNNHLAGNSFETPKGKRKREPISIYPEFDSYLEWCAVKGLAQSTIAKRHYIVKCIADGFSGLGLEKINQLDMRIV